MGIMWQTTASGAGQDEVAAQRLAPETNLAPETCATLETRRAAAQDQTVGQRMGAGRLAWQPLQVESLAGQYLALRVLTWWAVWGLPLPVAVLLVIRRLDGALTADPPLFGVFILVGLGLAATAAALVLSCARRSPGQRGTMVGRPSTWLLGLTPPAAMLATTWAVWLPSSAAAIPCLLLACALGQLVLFCGGTWGAYASGRLQAVRGGMAVQPGKALQAIDGVPQPVVPAALHKVDQHLVRGRDAAGRELVAGTLWLVLPQGSQHATAHVAFCPPLQGTPQVQCRQQSGPQARLKVTQAAPFGARFEARLPQPSNGGTTLCVHFTAAVPTDTVAKSTTQAALQPGVEHAAGAVSGSVYADRTLEPSGSTRPR